MSEEILTAQTSEDEAATATETAVTAEMPEAPEIPVTPEAPEAPEIPVAPEAPEVPVTPEAPEVPVTPEAPEIPVTPEAPEIPVSPEPAPAVSKAPEKPETPTESMADYEDAIAASMKPIHEGDILNGTIIGVSDEELVVDLGIHTEGVVRLEDASDDPSFSLKSFSVGQPISATVIRRDNAQGRIQLSLKAAAAVLGWERLQQLQKDQSNITVKISEAVKSGVTTYVEGIRGFIPASKLSLNYVENLDEFVGREIEVRVITADPEEKRLVLSARDILREKAEEERKKKISNVQVGLVTEGTVETLQPYGAFVNLGNGLSGLIHVSQISQQRIKHPSAVLKEGQTVKVKIIAVKDGKISLSMKALEDVAAEAIEEETFHLPKAEEATTSLASLFKNIKL